MKKFIAMLVALAIAFIASFALASPAAADRDVPSPDNNKKVELCHYDGSNENGGSGKYSYLNISVNAFYVAGHIDHLNDIYEGFTWTDNKGVTHTVEGRNTDKLGLLLTKCEVPVEDEKVAKPEATYNDACGTKDDVFSVAPGKGYTVGNVVLNNDGTQSITATLLDGFVWTDGSDAPVVITKPGFTNEPCDLPETGSATTNVIGGIVVLGLLAAGGLFLYRRRNTV